jgi:hypothetical protein
MGTDGTPAPGAPSPAAEPTAEPVVLDGEAEGRDEGTKAFGPWLPVRIGLVSPGPAVAEPTGIGLLSPAPPVADADAIAGGVISAVGLLVGWFEPNCPEAAAGTDGGGSGNGRSCFESLLGSVILGVVLFFSHGITGADLPGAVGESVGRGFSSSSDPVLDVVGGATPIVALLLSGSVFDKSGTTGPGLEPPAVEALFGGGITILLDGV